MTMNHEMNSRKEERFYLDENGALRHCLPGEIIHDGGSELVFSFDRGLSVVLPLGAAKPSGQAERGWGGYCRTRCRLVLPHRFVSRHKGELRKGKTSEMILADAVRDVVLEGMQRFARQKGDFGRFDNEQAMWNQIRTGLHDRLLSEGWLQEEFRPGAFQLRGA